MQFNSYTYKKKAINTVIRKIVPKKSWIKLNKNINLDRNNSYFDKQLYKKKKDLPIMVAFGKGNGSTTISNLRNNGPKGPIKRIALALSQISLVILTDEYRTSKLCNECKEYKMTYPKTDFIKKNKQVVKKLCHGLCYCKNKIHLSCKTNVHKLWKRDLNSAKNILFVMKQKLLRKKLGYFSRRIKNIPDNNKNNLIID